MGGVPPRGYKSRRARSEHTVKMAPLIFKGDTFIVNNDERFRNWYVWNPHNWRFDDYGMHMQRHHYQGAFTRIPEDAAMLRGCNLK